MKLLKLLAAFALAFPTIAPAQVASPATQVQGTPTDINRGYPVKGGCVYNSAAPTATDTKVVECQANVNGAQKVETGCTYNSTPITVTNTNSAPCQLGSRGSLRVELFSASGAGSLGITGSNADAAPTSSSAGVLGLNLVFNGTTVDRMRGDTNATSVSPTGLSGTYWRYTSGTSPILSNTTTAVTIKAASGASVKTFLDSCEIGSTALGASVPFAFRDGAGGTVMFAVRPPTAGWLTPFVVHFSPPLVGTANTLMEVVTTTADTSGTFDVNCQGHTGS